MSIRSVSYSINQQSCDISNSSWINGGEGFKEKKNISSIPNTVNFLFFTFCFLFSLSIFLWCKNRVCVLFQLPSCACGGRHHYRHLILMSLLHQSSPLSSNKKKTPQFVFRCPHFFPFLLVFPSPRLWAVSPNSPNSPRPSLPEP